MAAVLYNFLQYILCIVAASSRVANSLDPCWLQNAQVLFDLSVVLKTGMGSGIYITGRPEGATEPTCGLQLCRLMLSSSREASESCFRPQKQRY